MKWLGWFFLVVIIGVPTIYVAWLALTTKHHSVTDGSAYGFSIGDGKEETISVVKKLITSHGYKKISCAGKLKWVKVKNGIPAELYDCNIIYVAIGEEGDLQNMVRLTFSEGELSRIYRHRQYYELP